VEFGKALQEDANSFDALYNLGQILADAGALQEAEALLTRATAARQDADAERLLAITLAAEGKLAAALPHMQAAARLAPGDGDVQRLLAKLQTEVAASR
jgi:tetratricopeptide (TPR) repeat protein